MREVPSAEARSVVVRLVSLPILLLMSALVVVPAFAQQRPGATERVSIASDVSQANNPTIFPDANMAPVISADGHFVAFQSRSTNRVPGDTNAAPDIFLHDTRTGVTTIVSVNSNGVQGNNTSFAPSITGDGRFVAFMSAASNLVPGGDSNPTFYVFVHDRQTGDTELVHVDSNGVQWNGFGLRPTITPDGRFVELTLWPPIWSPMTITAPSTTSSMTVKLELPSALALPVMAPRVTA